MSKHKDTAAVVTYSDHEVIKPAYKLRKAVIGASNAADESDLVARAEAALAGLSDDFGAWMEAECMRLDQARNTIITDGLTTANKELLFRAAHDIKGEAATFGFPAVAAVADSLCRLVEYAPDATSIPTTLINQHVDAVRAIFRDYSRADTKAADNKALAKKELAKKLTARLREVTDEFLIYENRDRPEVLDQIAGSPSLAPE